MGTSKEQHAKTPKELANEYGVHVNTIYSLIKRLSEDLNHRKGQKKLTPKQVQLIKENYG